MILETKQLKKEIEKLGFTGYAYNNFYKFFMINNKKYRVILIFKRSIRKQEMILINTIFQKELFSGFYINTTKIPIELRYIITKNIIKIEKKCKKTGEL